MTATQVKTCFFYLQAHTILRKWDFVRHSDYIQVNQKKKKSHIANERVQIGSIHLLL